MLYCALSVVSAWGTVFTPPPSITITYSPTIAAFTVVSHPALPSVGADPGSAANPTVVDPGSTVSVTVHLNHNMFQNEELRVWFYCYSNYNSRYLDVNPSYVSIHTAGSTTFSVQAPWV